MDDDKSKIYEGYNIVKLINGQLLYIHFTLDKNYHFKAGILGACIFKKDNATAFINDMFGPLPTSGCSILKMKTHKNNLEITKTTEQDSEVYIKRSKRNAKKKQARKNKKLTNIPQGPDINEELPIPPLE